MKTVIKNILNEIKPDVGNWAYLMIVIMIPIYYFAKLFNIHNKTYEYKDDE